MVTDHVKLSRLPRAALLAVFSFVAGVGLGLAVADDERRAVPCSGLPLGL